MDEKRKDWRARITLSARVYIKDVFISALVEDVGGGGIKIISQYKFTPGEPFKIIIPEFNPTYIFDAMVLECISTGISGDFITRASFEKDSKKECDKLLTYLIRRFA
ncbi:MAG: PilZ domain-containing protein [Candidatus Hydrogenedentota bacterium]